MPARTRADRSVNASIAALSRWANEDPKANAERGQAGLRAKFEREVREAHPDLPDAEIQRRAAVLYRLHFKRLRKARTMKGRAARTGGGQAA